MNKQRIHDILSSIQMSPRDKKDLVNAIANGGGINNNTPIKESIDGTELVPIFDGENKAVSVNELIKGDKEVLYVDISNIQEEGSFIMSYDDYKNHIVYFTVTANKITFIAEKVFSTAIYYYGSVSYEDAYLFRCNAKSTAAPYPVDTMLLTVNINVDENSVTFGRISNVKQIIPFSTGDGTKFLSDDGTYKTIDIASLQTKIAALEGTA